MTRRVPFGIDHLTVVPENIEATPESDGSEEAVAVDRTWGK